MIKKEFIRSFNFIGIGKSKKGDSGSCEYFKETYNPVNIY